MTTRISGDELRARTVTLDITVHRPGNVRFAKARLETEADPTWTRSVKTIFKSDAYKRACKCQDDAVIYLRSIRVPSPLQGYYTLRVEVLTEVYDRLDAFDCDIAEAVEEFCCDYEAAKVRAQGSLKDLYSDRDYPNVDRFRYGLTLERKLIDLGTPSADKVGTVIAEAEIAKARRFWDEAAAEAVYGLREAFAGLVERLADQLAPAPDGSKKRLTEAAVEAFKEFIDLFDKRNVGDDELKTLIEQAKALVAGKGVDLIRGNSFFRNRLAKQMGEVKAAVGTLLVDAPKRRIRFGKKEG